MKNNLLKTKSCFLKPSCFLTSIPKRHEKINCTNIILSLKGTFDVSAVLLQNVFETTSPFADACETAPRLVGAHQVPNMHNACCCSSRPCTAFIFPYF